MATLIRFLRYRNGARAKAAGAGIVDHLETGDYAGNGYRCRDPESHLWSFGDHDPWAEQSA